MQDCTQLVVIGYASFAKGTYVYITSQNTMYCGGEPEYHIRNVTSRISIC